MTPGQQTTFFLQFEQKVSVSIFAGKFTTAETGVCECLPMSLGFFRSRPQKYVTVNKLLAFILPTQSLKFSIL